MRDVRVLIDAEEVDVVVLAEAGDALVQPAATAAPTDVVIDRDTESLVHCGVPASILAACTVGSAPLCLLSSIFTSCSDTMRMSAMPAPNRTNVNTASVSQDKCNAYTMTPATPMTGNRRPATQNDGVSLSIGS